MKPSGDAGSAGAENPGCQSGGGCVCDNGLIGSWDCALDACSCAACPAFAPPTPPPFEACGGDPTGLWRAAKKNDERGYDLKLTGPTGQQAQCRGQFTEQVDQTYFLELKAGGEAALSADIPARKFQILESCLGPVSAQCSSLKDLGCVRGECGLCDCTEPASSGVTEELSWSVTMNELSLSGKQGSAQFTFCVAGDTLTYLPKGSTEPLAFERIYRTGAPQPCAERTPEDCEKGEERTCRLGQCVGTGSCDEAAGEAACAKFQNCAWQASSCYGSVSAHCSLSELINVAPGCALAETPPRCVGTPLSCELQPRCAAKGCLIGAACVGGKQPCEYDDEGIDGCVCDLICEGTLDCATIKDAQTCEDSGDDRGAIEACSWSTTACIATAAPCEELSVNECETTIGCHLQAQ